MIYRSIHRSEQMAEAEYRQHEWQAWSQMGA